MGPRLRPERPDRQPMAKVLEETIRKPRQQRHGHESGGERMICRGPQRTMTATLLKLLNFMKTFRNIGLDPKGSLVGNHS